MPRLELRTSVEAPRERVFDLSRSIDLHADSMHQSREYPVAGVTSGLIRQGQSVTWRARHFGVWFRLTSRIFLIALTLSSAALSGSQPSADAPSLETLADLADHVGEYPCLVGLLDDPVLQDAIAEVLGADYEDYVEHLQFSGCGAIHEQDTILVMDVSQQHVGGYSSLVFVYPSTKLTYIFWLRGTVRDKSYQLYGKVPVPEEVRKAIVDRMNEKWGHVASFSWIGERLDINLNSKR